MIITLISDTHSKHHQVTSSLPGGDLLLHAGDMSSMGYKNEIENFCKWFDKLDNYGHKIFIAGNHDWGFQNHPAQVKEIINSFKDFHYLEDELIEVGDFEQTVKVYGSPWQPEFYNWAFNLPRNGSQLKSKWDAIPENTDILITHGPAYGYVDTVIGQKEHLGCELLTDRIKVIKPKIHVCGHIHSGYGYVFDGDTHFINASVLNEDYIYTQKPLTIDWNPKTNELIFL